MRQWLIEHAANDVPLVLLVVMMAASLWMLICASRNPSGTVGKMLQDENSKPSVLRLTVLWGFIVASWVVMKDVLSQDGSDPTVFAIYCGTTFGAHVAVKISEKWSGDLPWTKKGS